MGLLVGSGGPTACSLPADDTGRHANGHDASGKATQDDCIGTYNGLGTHLYQGNHRGTHAEKRLLTYHTASAQAYPWAKLGSRFYYTVVAYDNAHAHYDTLADLSVGADESVGPGSLCPCRFCSQAEAWQLGGSHAPTQNQPPARRGLSACACSLFPMATTAFEIP